MGFAAIVIGSGPSGVSCASALLRAGHRVTMLDTGLRLEPEYTVRLERLKSSDPSTWPDSADSDFLREHIAADVGGIPLKRAWGSDFPYRSVNGATSSACSGAHSQPSLALGGLSNVWGAAMLPYRQADMEGWPVSEADLAPHYESVLSPVPLAGQEDSLRSLFPLYAPPAGLPASSQARALFARWDRNRAGLSERKIHAGSSRLAVSNSPENPCVTCGLCMYGCPRDLIYSSAARVATMTCQSGFSYRPDVYVRRVEEGDGVARALGFAASTGETLSFDADRIFVACGPVGSASLLLRSMDAYLKPLPMADSQYFLQPCFGLDGARGVFKERVHTLSQAFVEIVDEAISPYTIHLQVYTYNELFRQAIENAAGVLHRLVPKEVLLGRLILLQGYLHSSESASMICTLEKTDGGDTLHIEAVGNRRTPEIIRQVQNKLLGAVRLTGLIPVPPLLRPGEPGRGYHSGGTFPMSRSPSGFQTDIAGTPVGFSRIHVVDSSVFPSIAATTITLTSMANAHRIATLAGQA